MEEGGGGEKGREREDRRRDDEFCLAIWALFLQRPQIKTQPVWRGDGEEGGGGIELSKGNNTSNLFLPLCVFKRGVRVWRGGRKAL